MLLTSLLLRVESLLLLLHHEIRLLRHLRLHRLQTREWLIHVLVALIISTGVLETLSLCLRRLDSASPKVVEAFVLICLDQVASYLASFPFLLLLKGQVLLLLLLHSIEAEQSLEVRHLFSLIGLLLLL